MGLAHFMSKDNRSSVPDWQRPFANDDFRGFFTWKPSFTKKLGSSLFHACHADEAQLFIDEKRLALRSSYSITHPSYGKCTAPCVWCGLNYYSNGNKYGPVLIGFPLEVLNGRTFMVFRRKGEDRERHFFLQYEASIPIFTHRQNPNRRVKPAKYFDVEGDGLSLKSKAIYDILLTQPISSEGATIEAIGHPTCLPKKCNGLTQLQSFELIKKLGQRELSVFFDSDPGFHAILSQFPDLMGQSVSLPLNFTKEK